jgi:hypothetical protein
MDDLTDLLHDLTDCPATHYGDLLAECIAGGLMMLAAAEKIAHSHPALAGLMCRVATTR